ncbi:HAD family hydrolase [Candidatus Daviesbacteria bacterium]|nr:HAD family hydrolase [Candidatus Daviesbacteria bacterium]
MSAKSAFFIDVDNTLLDNDHIKDEIKISLVKVFGQKDADHFWHHYNGFRDYQKYIDFPKIIRGYCHELHGDKCRMEFMQVFNSIEFKHALYPKVPEVLKYLKSIGLVNLFTEGDLVYQKRKVEESGLKSLVDKVYLFDHKMDHLEEVIEDFADARIVFIEDRADYLGKIKSLHPEIFIIHITQGHYAKIKGENFKTINLKFKKVADLLTLKIHQIAVKGKYD